MDDLTQQLQKVLSDPQTMGQLQGLLSSLGGQEEKPAPAPSGGPDLSALLGALAAQLEALKEEDLPFLAESAYADACRPGNPRDTSVEEIEALYKSQL